MVSVDQLKTFVHKAPSLTKQTHPLSIVGSVQVLTEVPQQLVLLLSQPPQLLHPPHLQALSLQQLLNVHHLVEEGEVVHLVLDQQQAQPLFPNQTHN